MVSQIVDPPDHLRAEAQKLAEGIARQPSAALAASKVAVWRALETRERGGPLQE